MKKQKVTPVAKSDKVKLRELRAAAGVGRVKHEEACDVLAGAVWIEEADLDALWAELGRANFQHGGAAERLVRRVGEALRSRKEAP